MRQRVPAAPKAPRKDREICVHGDARVDSWFWLRDLDDPDTLAYIRAENAYADAALEPMRGLQQALYKEMRARIAEDDSAVPEPEGEYAYYTRYQVGQQHPVYCRQTASGDASEEVLLDVNALAGERPSFQIGVCRNSPDHRWLVYSVDADGSERYRLRIKDLRSGDLLDEAIPDTYYALAWAGDSRSFFYQVLDAHHRPKRIYLHRLGEDPARDLLVYEEQDGLSAGGVLQEAPGPVPGGAVPGGDLYPLPERGVGGGRRRATPHLPGAGRRGGIRGRAARGRDAGGIFERAVLPRGAARRPRADEHYGVVQSSYVIREG